ncbi:MAG: hypothetical protein ACLPUO_05300 [Streptosporangiaceae bacterium]
MCATLAGARSYTAIAEWACDAPKGLRAELGLPGAVPDLVTPLTCMAAARTTCSPSKATSPACTPSSGHCPGKTSRPGTPRPAAPTGAPRNESSRPPPSPRAWPSSTPRGHPDHPQDPQARMAHRDRLRDLFPARRTDPAGPARRLDPRALVDREPAALGPFFAMALGPIRPDDMALRDLATGRWLRLAAPPGYPGLSAVPSGLPLQDRYV